MLPASFTLCPLRFQKQDEIKSSSIKAAVCRNWHFGPVLFLPDCDKYKSQLLNNLSQKSLRYMCLLQLYVERNIRMIVKLLI